MYTDAYTHTQHIKRDKSSKWFCKTKLAFYLLTSEQGNPTELGVGHHTNWKGFTPLSFLRITPTTIPSRTYATSAGTAEGFVEGRYLDTFWAIPPSTSLPLQGPGAQINNHSRSLPFGASWFVFLVYWNARVCICYICSGLCVLSSMWWHMANVCPGLSICSWLASVVGAWTPAARCS